VKRLLIITLVALVALATTGVCSAQAPETGDYQGTAAVLDLGMGARPLGMGGAFAAVADDVNAICYNPAGLVLIADRELTTLYVNLFGVASYMGLGYAQKGVGGGVLMLDSSGIEGLDEWGNLTGYFGYGERVVLAALATKVQGIAVGATLKHYTQMLPDNPGSGFTLDAGLLYEAKELRFAAVAKNVLGAVSYADGSSDAFDREFVLGVSGHLIPELTLALDYETSGTLRAGGEYDFGLAKVRGGMIYYVDGGSSWVIGLGVPFENLVIDYAYQMHGELPDSHHVSVGLRF